MREAVDRYTVFGRVKPEQKKQIVEALKARGSRVAMTGDGVNDILAMKEADCSIALGAGSDAAMQAAQIVLLDSDFSHMRDIIAEGRRDINNLTRSATLFLYKNIFSMLLACSLLSTPLPIPCTRRRCRWCRCSISAYRPSCWRSSITKGNSTDGS
jgi:cation-transporting ATPase E